MAERSGLVLRACLGPEARADEPGPEVCYNGSHPLTTLLSLLPPHTYDPVRH